MTKEDIRHFFEKTATARDKWRKRNRFYHKSIERYISFIIPEGKRVLEVGCSNGDLLNATKPAYGVGIDFSENFIKRAREKYPNLVFHQDDVENLQLDETFDYIILSDLVNCLWDVQTAMHNIRRLCHPQTRIVISQYNYLWEPILKAGETLRLKLRQPAQNWFSISDIDNILQLEGFQLIKIERKLLLPKYVPVLNFIFNKFLANLPLINKLNLVNFMVARPLLADDQQYSVSIVVPARNERGNIENAILRTPKFGKSREFIFVEGHSSDNTFEEMLRVQQAYPGENIKVFQQSGKGKGNAVREGFEAATGEVLMILDADLTMPPEELPKFYDALRYNKGEFINGSRLVYPMDKNAMRFLNLLANKFFGWFFSYILGQRLKDTLCGTKVLYKTDYEKIIQNRSYFGDFDPFGDFDLLFGAAKLNLKISEIIIRYRDREYGSTQISRFRHGWLLIRMSLFAARKIKFI
ncbi:MAG TPA: bifunctional class I SAM-dependent methyltransferase/glycosyltransferase family 2 protein [Bacteroidales bacterium]|jgi:SAM-dependent methyltransferase|nr:bifunctional class I SAM-dependent methyltransferase/glycosyltransferase family 2 protein [Bacteroidales bacterium]